MILLYFIYEVEILKKTNNKAIFNIDEEGIINIVEYIQKCVSKNISYSQIKKFWFNRNNWNNYILE